MKLLNIHYLVLPVVSKKPNTWADIEANPNGECYHVTIIILPFYHLRVVLSLVLVLKWLLGSAESLSLFLYCLLAVTLSSLQYPQSQYKSGNIPLLLGYTSIFKCLLLRVQGSTFNVHSPIQRDSSRITPQDSFISIPISILLISNSINAVLTFWLITTTAYYLTYYLLGGLLTGAGATDW